MVMRYQKYFTVPDNTQQWIKYIYGNKSNIEAGLWNVKIELSSQIIHEKLSHDIFGIGHV